MDTDRRTQLLAEKVLATSPSAVAAFYSWVSSPSPDGAELEKVLDAMDVSDLEHIMYATTDLVAGRLAWAEYGRRKGYMNFHIYLKEVSASEIVLEYVSSSAVVSGLSFRTSPAEG